MKTLIDIKNELNDLKEEIASLNRDILKGIKEGKTCRSERTRVRSLKKKMQTIDVIRLYLETNPSQESINDQRNKLILQITQIDSRAPKPKEGQEYNPKFKELIKQHDRMYRKDKLSSQLKVLNYIMR